MNTAARHSVSVAAVITNDRGRALLIQRRDNNQWEPPGGVLELDESIEDGLRREAREETGLAVEPVALTGIYKNMSRGIVALVFRCKVAGGQLTANDEVTAFQWADEDQVRELLTDAYAIRVTRRAAHQRRPGHPPARRHPPALGPSSSAGSANTSRSPAPVLRRVIRDTCPPADLRQSRAQIAACARIRPERCGV